MTRRDKKWEDSGFDCTHCGGEILKHAHQTIPEKEHYFQCRQCGCCWSVSGDMIRIGDSPHCQQRSSQRPSLLQDKRFWWAVTVAGILLLFFRFGGTAVLGIAATVIRFLIPLGILVLISMVIYWVGRQQDFWR
jgi:hypothetical protein